MPTVIHKDSSITSGRAAVYVEVESRTRTQSPNDHLYLKIESEEHCDKALHRYQST